MCDLENRDKFMLVGGFKSNSCLSFSDSMCPRSKAKARRDCVVFGIDFNSILFP